MSKFGEKFGRSVPGWNQFVIEAWPRSKFSKRSGQEGVVYIYICIYKEREREREKRGLGGSIELSPGIIARPRKLVETWC